MKVLEEIIRALYNIRDVIKGNNGESSDGNGDSIKNDLNITYPIGVYKANLSPSVRIEKNNSQYMTFSDEQKQVIKNSEFINFEDFVNNPNNYTTDDKFIAVYDKISDNMFIYGAVNINIVSGGILNINKTKIYQDYITDEYFTLPLGSPLSY